MFASKAGLEFLAIVANSPLLQKFDRNLRQLILSQKKKDFVFQANGKSAFYTVIFKVIRRINKLTSFEAIDILQTTAADLAVKDPV